MPGHSHAPDKWDIGTERSNLECERLNLLLLESSGDSSATTRTQSHHLPRHGVQLLVCQPALFTCIQTHQWLNI